MIASMESACPWVKWVEAHTILFVSHRGVDFAVRIVASQVSAAASSSRVKA
jgi:hypothetical protein